MAGAVVGIDLGTTNTVVAVVRGGKALVLADENGARLLPSVVSFHPSGEVLVGGKARERRLVDARNTVYSIKRLIGRSWQSDEVERARQRFPFELREGPTHGPLVVARGETYTLPEISAFVLRRAKAIAERALGEPVERAVVTVPASFNDLQRASTKVAAREAGLEVLRILNEPTAAALAYGFGKTGSERIAVYDFGGGTFDLTLLDLSGNVFEVIATAGDSFLGGDDVDTAIADKIALDVIAQTRFDPRGDVQVMERLRAAAEQVKIALSSQQDMAVELKELGYGPGGSPIDTRFNLNRGQLEQLAGNLIERTFKVCTEALQLARLKEDAFDNIILVGGSTRIPLVRKRVEEFFAKKPMDRVNPDEVVAIGAAIQAAALTGAERRRQSTPAPILNTDAVKASRIQTLGGLSKPGPRGPAQPPPPPRTTGRVITAPLPTDAQQAAQQPRPASPSKSEVQRDAAEGVKTFEDALEETTTTFHRKPGVDSDLPPPQANEAQLQPGTQYPMIPGAIHPSRSPVTAPLVPQSQHGQQQGLRSTNRNITPPPVQPVFHVGPPPFDASPEPQTLPRAFPEHSPEPIALQNLAPAPAPAAPMFPPPGAGLPPPPQPNPSAATPPARPRTQIGIAPIAGSVPPLPMPGASPPASLPGPLPGANPAFPFTGAPSSYPPPAAGGMAGMPLLIDVTPLTLSVETVGGYVDRVIGRNTAVPCSQTRSFTTSVDNQVVVMIRVSQGESDSFSGNTALGELELSGLRPARRGEVTIEVTFELDADGILQVRARDMETSRETRAQMRLIGLEQGRAARAATAALM